MCPEFRTKTRQFGQTGVAQHVQEKLVKAAERRGLQTLTAPVDGTVQQVAVHTVGGVVTPAQPLLVIVPAESHLEIETMVSNRDIGFVHAGEPAQIKVDTSDFRGDQDGIEYLLSPILRYRQEAMRER